MAGHDDAQERTEQATAKRQDEARERGQIARSRELTTVFVLFGGAAALHVSGARLLDGLAAIMRASLALTHADIFAGTPIPQRLLAVLVDGLLAVAPILALGFIVALVAPLALGGWNFTLSAAAPKFERLDPLRGLARLLGTHGLLEMVKALAKFAVILTFAVLALRAKQPALLALAHGSLAGGLAASAALLFDIFLLVSAATVMIAAVDVPLQLWQHGKQLRMSRQELRDETRESEGSPELKGRVRSLQQETARRRMMQDVPKADVIITNPEHYAVALRFDPKTMRAPLLVAKGVEDIARNIRELAAAHAITVLSAPPLARAIYHTTKINREIPAGLYVAVARVLAYVFQLRAGATLTPPANLPIPDEFTF